jgi:hypothetical protein
LADAYERAEERSGSEDQYAVTCSSEEELEHIADALGVEVQTQSGARLAVRAAQRTPRIVATFKPGAGTSGDSREALPASRRSGWPLAMVMREVRQALRDQQAGVHWSHGLCWCEVLHADGPSTGLRTVPPPWDASRDLESTWPAAGSS